MIKKLILALILILKLSAFNEYQALYKERCILCHGSLGKQKPLGKNASLNIMTQKDIVAKLNAYKYKELDIYGMGPLMQGQTNALTKKQIIGLAKYISKLKENTK